MCSSSSRCKVNLTNVNLRHPVYMYYKLENFYQNHRRYVKSRNDAQLQGQVVLDYASLEDCDPRRSKDNSQNASLFYVPCGLIAWSLFNGFFTFPNPLCFSQMFSFVFPSLNIKNTLLSEYDSDCVIVMCMNRLFCTPLLRNESNNTSA